MKTVPVLAVSLLTSFVSPAAMSAVNVERLVQGCQELVAIYSNHDERRLMAGVTTSVSEAMRAGYCMGVINEYQRTTLCGVRDWHVLASRIAEIPVGYARNQQANYLLVTACEG